MAGPPRPRLRGTHTYAILEVSPEAYNEIHEALERAGYHHTFIQGRGEAEIIDMAGIALRMRPYDKVRELNPNMVKIPPA